MSKIFKPVGIVIQDLERIPHRLPKNYEYDGICAYYDNPLEDKDIHSDAKLLQQEFYDCITYQKQNGIFSVYPEAIYSPLFAERYLKACVKLKKLVKCLFIEYDGETRFWNYELPRLELLGYEVCSTPRDTRIIDALDSDYYTNFRNMLNCYGIFSKASHAEAFKEQYEYDFKNNSLNENTVCPELHIFKVYEIKEFPHYIKGF